MQWVYKDGLVIPESLSFAEHIAYFQSLSHGFSLINHSRNQIFIMRWMDLIIKFLQGTQGSMY